MTVVVVKWAGVSFDDPALAKILILPSDAKDDTPITFHDLDGDDYQVPGGKQFIVGRWNYQVYVGYVGRVGESDAADGAITKEVIKINARATEWFFDEVIGVYSAGKYVTAETTGTGAYLMDADTTLYGVEIDA